MVRNMFTRAVALLLAAGLAVAPAWAGVVPPPPLPAVVTYTPSTTAWTMTSTSPDISVGGSAGNSTPQGYAWDGAHHFLATRQGLYRRNDDATWSLDGTNATPQAGVTGALASFHIGDIDVYGGRIYAPTVNFPSTCGAATNPRLVEYDTTGSMTLLAQTDWSGTFSEVSAIAIDSSRSVIWAIGFCTANTLYKFDLTTKAFISSAATTGAGWSNAQGLQYNAATDRLYISFNNATPGIVEVNPTTSVATSIFTDTNAGSSFAEIEGIGLRGTQLAVQKKFNGSFTFVNFLTPPNGAIERPTLTVSSTAAAIGVARDAPSVTGLRVYDTIGVGPNMNRVSTPLGYVAAEAGFVAGTNVPSAMLDLTKNNAGTSASTGLPLCFHGKTLGGSTANGEGFMCVTDSNFGFGAGALAFGTGAISTANIKAAMATDGGLIAGFSSFSTNSKGAGTLNVSAGLYVNGVMIASSTAYTVSTLPTCNTANKGGRAFVTDATSPTFLGTLAGGGAVVAPAFCNGTGWVAY